MSSCYLFSNQVLKTLKVFKDLTFQMVLGAPGQIIWLAGEISGININDHFQWFVVGSTEISLRFSYFFKKKVMNSAAWCLQM